MPYVTVFDISKQPFEWWWPAIGRAIVAIGIIFIKYVSRWPSQKNAKIIGWGMVAFGLVFTIVVYNSISSMWADWRRAYEQGAYSTVEGVVQDFKPMPYEGHQDECFRVKNEKFCYSDYVVQPGFHQSASHGGPIREGLPVRIAYSNGQILRLDIGADSLPSADERASYAKTQRAKWHDWVKNDPTNDRLRLAFYYVCILKLRMASRPRATPPPWSSKASHSYKATTASTSSALTLDTHSRSNSCGSYADHLFIVLPRETAKSLPCLGLNGAFHCLAAQT